MKRLFFFYKDKLKYCNMWFMLSIKEIRVVGYGSIDLKDKKNDYVRYFYCRSDGGRVKEGNFYCLEDYEDFGGY